MPRHREEVVNVLLAHALGRRGIRAVAEQVEKQGRTRSMPDIRVSLFGLPIVVEAKYDGPGARADVEQQARERLEQSLAAVTVALLYPSALQTSGNLERDLQGAQLEAKFFAPGRSSGWVTVAGVAGLSGALEQARGELADDDVVRDSADLLHYVVEGFANAVESQPGRLRTLLALVAASDAAGAGRGDRLAESAAARICGLAVATASMVQVELSRVDPEVTPLPKVRGAPLRGALIASWRKILGHDYAAVFKLAYDVLSSLEDDGQLAFALDGVVDSAEKIVGRRVLGRHDLVGRIYHTLLADRKYLATYYTSVSAATLLSALAFDPDSWPDVDWEAEPEDFEFRVGDLASGTGTLLASALGNMRQNWAAARASAGRSVDPVAFSRHVIEHCLWGGDILAYAVQVCAATLILSAPGTIIRQTHLYQMPFGGTAGRLGSLELVADGAVEATLFGDEASMAVGVDEPVEMIRVRRPTLDAVVMNPPFTRSVNSSRLLGSLDGSDHDVARKRLAALVRQPLVEANLNAGLGSLFVDLANRCVRPGGRLAVVLPKTVLTGQAWEPTRGLLARDWHVEHVITSHELGHNNFSDSTDLSEVLIIARRWRAEEDRTALTKWTALWHNPRTPVSALGVAAAIQAAPGTPTGYEIRVSDQLDGVVGETYVRPTPISGLPWRHAGFSRASLDAVAAALLAGEPVPLPRLRQPVTIPLKPLGSIATIGPDVRDIRDGFTEAARETGYFGWWGHDSGRVRTLSQVANRYLAPRSTAAEGRPLRSPTTLWEYSSRLMVAARSWLTTNRVTAVVLREPALGSMWWPVRLHEQDEDDERILALWFNSSLGILSLLYDSEETRGPWVQVKKNKLEQLPVLDPSALSAENRRALLASWDEVSEQALRPLSDTGEDEVRAVLDKAIGKVFGISPEVIDALRGLLAAEPRVAQRQSPSPKLAPPSDLTLF